MVLCIQQNEVEINVQVVMVPVSVYPGSCDESPADGRVPHSPASDLHQAPAAAQSCDCSVLDIASHSHCRLSTSAADDPSVFTITLSHLRHYEDTKLNVR